MGLITKLRSALSPNRRAIDYGVVSGIAGFLGRKSKYTRRKAIEKAYVGTVAIAVNTVSRRVSRFPLKVVRARQTSPGNVEYAIDERHPLAQLLWRPNPHMTWAEVAHHTAASLEVNGEFFWIIERTGDGRPAMLWPVRPDWMTEVPDATEFLSGWVYQPAHTAKGVRYDPQDVVHGKLPSISNPYRGASPIEQQAYAVDTEHALQAYSKAVVESGGRVDLHLKVDSEDPDTIKQARELIVAGYEQARKADRVMTTGNNVTLTPLSLKPNDLEFIGLAKMTREQLMIALGVPPEVVGFRESGTGRNTASEAYIAFNRDTIDPMLELVAKTVEHRLLPQFKDSQGQVQSGASEWYEISYDSPIPEDEERKAKVRAERIRSGEITLNEARAEAGLQPYDGYGDEPLVSAGYLPISALLEQVQAETEALSPDRSVRTNPGSGKPEGETSREEDPADREWRSWVRKLQAPAERRFIAMQRTLAEQQRAEVLAKADEHLDRIVAEYQGRYPERNKRKLDRNADDLNSLLFDPVTWTEIFGLQASAEIARMVRRAGLSAAANIGGDFEFFPLTQPIREWVRTQAFHHYAALVNQTTLDDLRRTLYEGLSAGEGVEQIRRRINGVFRDLSTHRARLAARTESTTALNFAADQAHEQALAQGIRIRKRWVAARDARTRPSHRSADGQLDDEGRFAIGGHAARFPGDPALPADERINCRCTVVSQRVDEDGNPVSG